MKTIGFLALLVLIAVILALIYGAMNEARSPDLPSELTQWKQAVRDRYTGNLGYLYWQLEGDIIHVFAVQGSAYAQPDIYNVAEDTFGWDGAMVAQAQFSADCLYLKGYHQEVLADGELGFAQTKPRMLKEGLSLSAD